MASLLRWVVPAVVALAAPAGAAAHGDEVPTSQLAGAWSPAPAVLLAAAIAAALFLQGWLRLRRRGRRDHAGLSRLVLFCLGLGLSVLALVSPLDAIAEEYLLSAHMLQHVLIADAGPALIAIAIRGPLCFFLLPRPLLRRLAPVGWLRGALSFLLRPWVVFGLWTLVILGWHVPVAYDATLRHPLLHDSEHLLFVLVGILAWALLVDPARHRRLSPPGRMLLAVGLLAVSHPVSDSLFFSSSPLYDVYAWQDERLLGWSALTDQRVAGAVMTGEQLLTLGTLVAILLWPYLRRRSATFRLRSRAAPL